MTMTHQNLTRITAVLLSSLLLPAVPVSAEETAAKDFLYYHTLSDYEVYQEYCELYGFTAEETLPEETALPDYEFLRHYTTSGVHGVVFYVYCEEEPYGLDSQPEMFGLPENWFENSLLDAGPDYEYSTYVPVVQITETGGITTTASGTTCSLYEIQYHLYNVSHFEPDYVEGSYEDSIVDIYRVRLSLHHSDFVAQYACHEDDINVSPIVQYYTISGGDTKNDVFGDINGDHTVDALDAACILEYTAELGAGNTILTLDQYLAQK